MRLVFENKRIKMGVGEALGFVHNCRDNIIWHMKLHTQPVQTQEISFAVHWNRAVQYASLDRIYTRYTSKE